MTAKLFLADDDDDDDDDDDADDADDDTDDIAIVSTYSSSRRLVVAHVRRSMGVLNKHFQVMMGKDVGKRQKKRDLKRLWRKRKMVKKAVVDYHLFVQQPCVS